MGDKKTQKFHKSLGLKLNCFRYLAELSNLLFSHSNFVLAIECLCLGHFSFQLIIIPEVF